MIRRAAVLSLLVGALVLLAASPAAADAAGPGDYRSEVVEVAPPADGVDVTVEGGDAFVAVRVDPGHEVVVIGYEAEPYLRIDPEGRVWQNTRSPATYLNQERYGSSLPPPEADAEATPEWEQIGSGGSWAWHDHRAHWMNEQHPVGAGPGDVIVEGVVLLDVDGTRVEATIRSTWIAAPSPLAAVLGGAVGVAGAVGLSRRPGPDRLALLAVLLGVAATAVALAEHVAVPVPVRTSATAWIAPASGAMAALLALGVRRLPDDVRIVVALAGAVQVAVWSLGRLDHLTAPVLPTTVPALDRAVTAATLASSAVLVVVLLVEVRRRYVAAVAAAGVSSRPPAPAG